MELAISVRALEKSFGDLKAVAGIDLDAGSGVCLGLLGPNGAGKTTTIEMLEGLTRADAGEIRLLGLDWRSDASEIRERIGVQLQETIFQDKLTVEETVRMFSSFYRQSRPVAETIALVNLEEKAKARVMQLSGGQRQRLALGCALVNRPDLLFLDEPTTGLDPQARRRVWEIIEDFKRSGGTVLLTTHYMDEAERLSDNLVIMDQGRIIAEGSPEKIIQSLGAASILEFSLDEPGDLTEGRLAEIAALPGVLEAKAIIGTVTLQVSDSRQALSSVIGWLEENDQPGAEIRTHRPTLEDVFVSLTGKHLRES